MQIQSFINSSAHKATSTFIKKNPFNSKILHHVESCELMQAVQAIQGAQKAFIDWKNSSLQQRLNLLKKIKMTIYNKRESFAQQEALDQGLPFQFVLTHGINACLSSLDSAILELEKFQVEDNTLYSANGVISIITSWNLSLRIIFERLAPALAAGNAIVIKISSHSPITAAILAEIVALSDFPIGLIQIIVTQQQDVKDLLVTHPAIKAISFVGNLKNSSDVLKKISQLSFNQFKKIQIATGCKNTAIALAAPNDLPFLEIMNSFLIGQGQLSWNSNRFFILEKFEKQWVEKIENYLSDLKPAKDIMDLSVWGPCIRDESFKHFSEIENLAKADQARLLQPAYNLNELEKECFLKPSFTKDMSNCSTLQQDQVLAPLFILSVVKYSFDIAKYSNVSYYGQSAHIWADPNKIQKIAEELEVSQVFKNKWSVESHQPNQGVKQSAFGLQDHRVFGNFFSNVKKMT